MVRDWITSLPLLKMHKIRSTHRGDPKYLWHYPNMGLPAVLGHTVCGYWSPSFTYDWDHVTCGCCTNIRDFPDNTTWWKHVRAVRKGKRKTYSVWED